MRKWEYATVGWTTQERMNEMGAEGWELVSVTAHIPQKFAFGPVDAIYALFFKRRIPEAGEAAGRNIET